MTFRKFRIGFFFVTAGASLVMVDVAAANNIWTAAILFICIGAASMLLFVLAVITKEPRK